MRLSGLDAAAAHDQVAHRSFSWAKKMPRLLELFSGTGSVGKAFAEAGWDVISLDMDPKSNATVTADFMQWDWSEFRPSHFDCIWASPPCTEYSIAKTTGPPRDMEKADKIAQRTLDCIKDLKPKVWFFENPQTGYLKGRRVVEGLRYKDASYCVWGFDYRKHTRIWSNADDWEPRPMCTRANPCELSRETGRHPKSAQRAPSKVGGVRRLSSEDKCSLDQLHSMPPELCDSICQEANRICLSHDSNTSYT